MAVLSNIEIIRRRLLHPQDPQSLEITPWPGDVPISLPGHVGYGISSAGFDFRLFHVVRRSGSMDSQDPAALDPNRATTFGELDEAGQFTLRPKEFILGTTVERFRIPLDCICQVMCKSTYARLGLQLTVTPLEPGWEGYVTLEIYNSNVVPITIHSNQGIGQVLFFKTIGITSIPYNKKPGALYQGQGQIPTCAKIRF